LQLGNAVRYAAPPIIQSDAFILMAITTSVWLIVMSLIFSDRFTKPLMMRRAGGLESGHTLLL
jgi:hypothetical protein